MGQILGGTAVKCDLERGKWTHQQRPAVGVRLVRRPLAIDVEGVCSAVPPVTSGSGCR